MARQCTLCEAHCGIRVTVEDERVTRIEGDPDDVLSHGYVCPRATALADLHHDPERLRRPLRRVGDGVEEVSWEQAFELVGRHLRRVRARHGRKPEVPGQPRRPQPPDEHVAVAPGGDPYLLDGWDPVRALVVEVSG